MKAKAIPHVSVLIDTYNHECFIERAITSVLEQDMPMDGVEILVVDVGQPTIRRKSSAGLSRACVCSKKPNGGQASAFNAGIPECQGEIVAFLDGDDWWAPQKLRRVVEAMEQDPEAGIIGNGITEVLENGDEHSEVLHETPRFRIDFFKARGFFGAAKASLARAA